MTEIYQRPTGSKATAVGDRNRRRWSRHLRERIASLISPVDFMTAEESHTLDAIKRQRMASSKYPWQDRPTWTTTRVRIDQMATLSLLQRRHLKATGKEISRAEVLAALMATGLEAIINHEDFGG
ncbi:MAG: hypothetical protein AAFW87_13750 [Pseudomonadota bacterium]